MMAAKSKDKDYINSNVVFVSQDMLMQDAVQQMIERGISSLLVVDSHDHVVGIITERDIVRKFTLLEMADKLTRTVGTIMTRPVMFAQVKTFHKDTVKMHLDHKIRHFPVLSAPEPLKENVVGIISITDLARHYMALEQGRGELKKTADQGGKAIVGILASQIALTNNYIQIFKNLGFDAREVIDIHQFASASDAASRTLILDLDGYSDRETHDMIPVAVKAKCHLILTTSQPNLVPIFKKYMDQGRQDIAMKPIDISYLSWLLLRKWQVNVPASEQNKSA